MSNNMTVEQAIKELTLLLLYLTSWEEDEPFGKFHRSWKGYDFDVLNELTDENLITGSHKAKSVYLTEQGVEKAKELVEKYLGRNK
ncbi:DUF6429 family protein [Effusibacillus lacus]|uniref:DUF6429 domain-containing protein n=1 Tax=Effusibacillus lacus TaxID=1348429 RepID=A0A292YMG6_9BACL|nr:DUF6429 family protein [Effusibacillus lacus]TCS69495.1 hypothetical protein EDD64_13611 [Effusibacillus lacus]GAX90089.1 hypothetical protein EFBL_1715 [Effusibacillus lacus]